MDKKVEDAIRVIEDAGGVVLIEERNDIDQMIDANSSTIDAEIEKDKYRHEYEDRKKDGFEDLTDALNRGVLSPSMADEILFENGLDLDDLEDWIYDQI